MLSGLTSVDGTPSFIFLWKEREKKGNRTIRWRLISGARKMMGFFCNDLGAAGKSRFVVAHAEALARGLGNCIRIKWGRHTATHCNTLQHIDNALQLALLAEVLAT
mmetsp:Transcript_46967/g.75675  ORF Transcript_46967/g.75675 Transcript_46967/m.75675 type:complete len:106 (+) Transcript_46967:1117-1434(+)